MKKLESYTEDFEWNGETYSAVVVKRNGCWNCYIETEFNPMSYVFGVPCDTQSAEDAIELIKANADEEIPMLIEYDWA